MKEIGEVGALSWLPFLAIGEIREIGTQCFAVSWDLIWTKRKILEIGEQGPFHGFPYFAIREIGAVFGCNRKETNAC